MIENELKDTEGNNYKKKNLNEVAALLYALTHKTIFISLKKQ